MEVPSGELHAIMGPNGSGKVNISAMHVMGNPDYAQSGVCTHVGDTDISKLTPIRKI